MAIGKNQQRATKKRRGARKTYVNSLGLSNDALTRFMPLYMYISIIIIYYDQIMTNYYHYTMYLPQQSCEP